MRVSVNNPLGRQFWLELFVAALAGFDKPTVRRNEGLEVLALGGIHRGHACIRPLRLGIRYCGLIVLSGGAGRTRSEGHQPRAQLNFVHYD